MNKINALCALLTAGLFYSASLLALPGDENQEIVILADNNETFLDRGVVIFYGTPEVPVEVTQGSLKITGVEVEVQRRDGQLHRITAQGSPATFQQQPEIDQPVVHASAGILVLDNSAGLLTLDNNASLSQGETEVAGSHIEYNRETERIVSNGNGADDRTRMIFTPQSRDE